MNERTIIGTQAAIEAEFGVTGRDAFTVVEMFDGDVVGTSYFPTLAAAKADLAAYGVEPATIEYFLG